MTVVSRRFLLAAAFSLTASCAFAQAIEDKLVVVTSFSKDVTDLIDRGVSFLRANKVISVDKLRPEAIMPEFTQQILKERGLKAPIGEVTALPESAYKGK